MPYVANQFVASLLGPVSLETPAVHQAIDLAELKRHCRVRISDDDKLLERKLLAATHYCQKAADRQFLLATYEVPVRAWWPGLALRLPKPPLSSVESIKYYAQGASSLSTLAPSAYVVHTPVNQPGWIELLPNVTCPGLDNRLFPIVVRYVAGYADPSDISPTDLEAIAHMTEYLYENRGDAPTSVPQSVMELLNANAWGGYA